MKTKSLIAFLILVAMSVGCLPSARSQVVISLLFGKKLNSENIKFGLDGGVSWTNLSGLEASENHTGINLGLYFDIRLKENSSWYLHTGLMVKSPLGADGLAPYSLDDATLDSLYMEGVVDRKLKYLNVPILLRYKLKDRFYIEAGPNFGVLVKAKDVFYESVSEDKDLSYEKNIYKECNWFDAGGMVGIGIQLMKGNGMDLGVRYYFGLTDIIKDNPSDPQHNQVYYLYASIPIGAGEKSHKKATD